jgi:redox-sensitive bicupin YhaK (pirin superfamily)
MISCSSWHSSSTRLELECRQQTRRLGEPIDPFLDAFVSYLCAYAAVTAARSRVPRHRHAGDQYITLVQAEVLL